MTGFSLPASGTKPRCKIPEHHEPAKGKHRKPRRISPSGPHVLLQPGTKAADHQCDAAETFRVYSYSHLFCSHTSQEHDCRIDCTLRYTAIHIDTSKRHKKAAK